MTREEAIKLLQGKRIATWNAYRKANRNWKPNLSSFEFPKGSVDKLNLSGADLRNTIFPKCNIQDLYLMNADLRGADLSKVRNASFVHSYMNTLRKGQLK